jgi:CRP-like cAMP-binding protein
MPLSLPTKRPSHPSTGNLFLDALTPQTLGELRPLLSARQLNHGDVIMKRGETVAVVLFPVNAILSVVLEMADGETAEVGIIGREGMNGLPLFLSASQSAMRTVVQIPDGGHALPAATFREAAERYPDLKALLLRYSQATLLTTAQLVACNTLHPIDKRCARWLLMAHDRVAGDTFLLTQEFLSQMLGVRRGGVTQAASTLQKAGFISYSRGRIRMLDRPGLESAACECYGQIDRDWEALMDYSIRKSKRA